MVVVAGAVFLTNKTLEVADLVTFMLYINNFTDPIKRLVSFTEQFQNGASGYERFLEIMNVEPDIVDDKHAVDVGTLQEISLLRMSCSIMLILIQMYCQT